MACKESNHQIIGQILNLLRQLDNSNYQQPLEVFNGSTLGQHFRHILDFYHCLILGLNQEFTNYNDRERNPMFENNVFATEDAFIKIQENLILLSENQKVKVVADFSNGQQSLSTIVQSSVGRELMYAYDHALHHLALIKIGLKINFPEIKVDTKMGVAPSTLRFWESETN